MSQEFGIDKLRLAVSLFNNCNETFNQGFTAEELIKIREAWSLSEWDVPPDEWTQRQLDEAVQQGRPPTWDDKENPTYDLTDDEETALHLARETLQTPDQPMKAKLLARWVYESLGMRVPRS